jgi:hypothetical protein
MNPPNASAPSGRIRKPAPNVARESVSDANWLVFGKNTRPIAPA